MKDLTQKKFFHIFSLLVVNDVLLSPSNTLSKSLHSSTHNSSNAVLFLCSCYHMLRSAAAFRDSVASGVEILKDWSQKTWAIGSCIILVPGQNFIQPIANYMFIEYCITLKIRVKNSNEQTCH